MGFLENLQQQKEVVQKAAEYDNLINKAKERSLYEQGLADKEREYIQSMKSANVTNDEIAAAQAAGIQNPTMEDIDYMRRLGSMEQLQGGSIGAPADAGLAEVYGKGY